MKKTVSTVSILFFSLLLPLNGLAVEKQRGTGDFKNCPVCSSNTKENNRKKTMLVKTKNVGCFSCNRKPCSASRTTWVQLYHKFIAPKDKTSSLSKKEQIK